MSRTETKETCTYVPVSFSFPGLLTCACWNEKEQGPRANNARADHAGHKAAIAEIGAELIELERLRQRKRADVQRFRRALELMNTSGETVYAKVRVIPIAAIPRTPKASE